MPFLLAILLVWLLKRTKLAKWSWNPLDWWNNATNAAGTILSDVKNWVLSIVSDAVNLVENDVFTVFQWAWSTIQDVQIAAYWFSQWAQSAISNLTSWASQAISAVQGLAWQWVKDLGGWASAAINAVQGLAHQWVTDLGNWASSALTALQNLAAQWVHDLGSWAATALQTLDDWAHAAFNDVYRWAKQALSDLWRDLYNTIYGDFIKPIQDVVHWVVLAWDWIVWFATHPFSVMHNIEHDVIDWEHQVIHEAEHIVRGEDFRKGLDAMGKFLGG